ncbi:oxidoreductase [Tianweitania sediminis]|uniref:Oxidoreductase n=1 Tax=Tianweitania sediminis TaxID=1502156 RepID=A0A8J7UMR8_9HYPH|nr:oxidoreductase [Tianweitania sediminis]MBP0440662.1 oxidoreductase [Tianweitania sediminis]
MVAMPELPSPTIAAIDAWHERKQEIRHYPFIRGSAIGHQCERALFYRFRWAHQPETFTGRMLRLFQTGHRDEARMVMDLRNAGIQVQDRDPKTRDQWEVEACDGHFQGHLDGIVEGLLEAPKTPHLLECKTHNAKSFAQLKSMGVEAAKPDHMAQMQVYMHLQGLTRAFYLAKSKDTDEYWSERIHYDPIHGAALVAKAERVRAAKEAPARVSDDPEYFLCKAFNCSSYQVCHGGAFALRNCRTCLWSEPIENANWFCHRHKRALLREEQAGGCPNHLYIPSLVPGEQIDADEQSETVTYTMRDGSQWQDGGRVAA